MNLFMRLLQLQEIEDKIRYCMERISKLELDGELELLDAQLKSERRLLHVAMQSQKIQEQNYNDKNYRVTKLNAEIRKLEEQLYGGVTQNSKQFNLIQAKIGSLQKQREELEEESIKQLIDMENNEIQIKRLSENISSISCNFEKLLIEKQALKNSLAQEIEELNSLRESTVQLIPEPAIGKYNALLKTKNNHPVAIVKNGICQGCHMGLSTSFIQKLSSPEKICFCESCGRIIGKPEWIV